MKNKIEFKKSIVISCLAIILISVIFQLVLIYQYKAYINNFNKKIEMIITNVENQYPGIDTNEIMKILNNETDEKTDIFKEYGINLEKDSIIIKNDKLFIKFSIINLCLIVGLAFIVLIIFIKYNNSKDKKLQEITKYIEEINNKNYKLDIEDNTEDELSILKNEIYKTTVMLKEVAENSVKDKVNLKDSLSDISHQLKTPLASLKLYNTLLIEEELDDEDRIEFLKTNEMSINKLHNLIDSLVNISRLEASMINIKIENKSIKQTLIKAINSTVPKANQKNININIEDFEDIEIPHDTKWTEESIFNVLENAVKYSSENKDINVQVSETINFIRIDIKDNGIGIDKSEYNNIFKRFYRSEKVDDIEGSGIGLYLSRKILEKQGGNIIVSSQKEQGSKFSLFLTKV